MKTYSVIVGYEKPNTPYEGSTEIIFSAVSDTQAVRDAMRWFQRRREVLPEVFGIFYYVKAALVVPAPIGEEGQYNLYRTPYFEYKYDWPGQLEDYLRRLS